MKRLDIATCALEDWLAASKRRFDLPPGSSRARVTTANARWATAAEACDRIENALRAEWHAAHADEVTP